MLPENARPVDPAAEAERLAGQRNGTLRVEIGGPPGREAVKVGGHVLACASARLVLAAGKMPEVIVHLPVPAGLEASLEAQVKVDRETRAALIAMGWREP